MNAPEERRITGTTVMPSVWPGWGWGSVGLFLGFLIRCGGGGVERKGMGEDKSSGYLYIRGFYFFSDVDVEFVGSKCKIKKEAKL